MPPVRGVSADPIINLANTTRGIDRETRQASALQSNLFRQIEGRPTIGTPFSLANVAQNSIKQGLHRTFFDYWIQQIVNFFKQLQSTFKLANGASAN